MNKCRDGLVKWQEECLEFIDDESFVMLSSSTGSGKTRVYEAWAFKKEERPIFITSPTKALSNQRFRELQTKGYKVGLETGDVHYILDGDCDIICCTQEIYESKYMEVANSTLIIDEFAYIFEGSERTRTYINSLRHSKASNIMICSATFGNPDEVLEYINKVTKKSFCLYENDERLTKLEYRGKIEIEDIRNSLVVAYSKDECYEIAVKLYEDRVNRVLDMARRSKGFDPRKRYRKEIQELVKKYRIDNKKLVDLAELGVVYYCGRLLPKEKLFVEELFEKRFIDTIVGTDALALGVNFPIQNVVFAQLSKGFGARISKNMFEQLSGRAGRKSYYDEGYVYYCNAFGRKKLGALFQELVKAPNENFRIILNYDIKSILLGKVSIEDEAQFLVDCSTNVRNYDEVFAEIQKDFDLITKLDVCSYYFKQKYGIDISNGFYAAIEGFEQKKQQELESISEKLLAIQVAFEQNIARVYLREFSLNKNCDIFIDILLGMTLDDLIKKYCMTDGNIELRKILFLRKYLLGLPEEFSKDYDLSWIENIINMMDFTVLHPHDFMNSSLGNKEEVTVVDETPKNMVEKREFVREFFIIKVAGKKCVKISQESDKMLVCDLRNYPDDYNLNLYYIPALPNYTIIGKIGYEEMLEVWEKVNFDSLGTTLDAAWTGFSEFCAFANSYPKRVKENK